MTQQDFDLSNLPILEGCEVVLRESVTEEDGTVTYAKDYDLKYFIKVVPIVVCYYD